MHIAPTARVDPRACIGEGVTIGDYCVVEPDVVIGAGCRLEPYVYVKRWTTLGEANEISAGTALGTERGDRLTPVLARGIYHWVLAFADGGLATAEVYAEIDATRAIEIARAVG